MINLALHIVIIKKENNIFSHLDISQLKPKRVLDFKSLSIDNLKNKSVYAYSHEEDRLLDIRNGSL
jgi:hypothetical protein